MGDKLTPKQEAFALSYVETGSVSKAHDACFTSTPISPGGHAYVYFLVRTDTDEIVYVGKGRGNRLNHHMRDFRNGHINGLKKHKGIRKLLESGVDIVPVLYEVELRDNDALEIERTLIELIGRDKLLNSCGSRGCPHRRAKEYAIACKKKIHPSHKGTELYNSIMAEFDEAIALCDELIYG